MTSRIPEKGDLAFLDFNPQSGVEQAGHRPCLVLTPSSFNQATGLAVVCPQEAMIGHLKSSYPKI